MRKANVSNGAESRKRRRESVSDGKEDSDSAQEERQSVQSMAKRPAPGLKNAKSIITARMPIKLLTTNWSLGSNRPLDPRHVQNLKKSFVELGGPKRDLEAHYLKVLCTGAEVKRMTKKLDLPDVTKQAEGMPDFTIWPVVNGREPLELLAGQHRIRALEEWVKDAKLGEEELWWPCKFYDRDSISLEQNLKLRVNSKEVTKPDSHGDIWLHLVTVVSQKPEKFKGKRVEVMRDMTDTLDLSCTGGVPMNRLLALWGNDNWRTMITAWCKTTVGRTTFKIRPWSLMMACRIDEFWFSTFRQVLETLASLPGDAASYVKSEDWKPMSDFLGHGRSEQETREFFYPSKGSQKVDQSCRRRPNLLLNLDRESYWQVYEHVVQSRQLSFPDVHRILGLSEQDGKILSGVINHVVDWLMSSHRSKQPPQRDNNKPGLRVDMVTVLQHVDRQTLQQAKGRLITSIGEARGQSLAETTSIVMQQELLEFVCGRLEAFRRVPAKDQLIQRLDTDNAGLYQTRFQQAEWAGVLDIVRSYMGPEFRLEWPRLQEESRPGDVSHFVDMAIHHWKALANLADDETRASKISSASFRDDLSTWLGEWFGAGEESSPSGPTTGEANADAESTTPTSAVSTRRDAGGEEDDYDPVRASDSPMTQREPLSSQHLYIPPSGQMPKTVLENRIAGTDAGGEDDDFDLGTKYDFAMAKAKNKTALSIPSTAKEKTALSVLTQKAAPAKRRQAQPPSPQFSSGQDQKMSRKSAGDTNLTVAQRMSASDASSQPQKAPPAWSLGVMAVQK
ncbi:hypothetical protein E4U36_006198 [Claviceps purpurea]|nr:hypothetical protein E4U36_006198 [Claviceps purpurea]